MLKRAFTICGFIFFLAGCGLGIYLIIGFVWADLLTTHDFCCASVEPYALDLRVSSSIISESETDVLTASFASVLASDKDSATVTLMAPGFDFSPSTSPRSITFKGSNCQCSFDISWVLSPIKLGTFQVAVEVDIPSENTYVTKYVGVTVTNVFGLRLWQIQLLSYIGTFLGPIMTAAWWYDRWKERKSRKQKSTNTKSGATVVTQVKVASKSSRRTKRKH